MTTKSNRWQVIWRGFSLMIIAAMLIGMGAGMAAPSRASAASALVTNPAPIDPDVYVSLEKSGNADVLIILEEQADLSAAAQIDTKTLKGYYVSIQLKAVAERTQGDLKAFLERKGVEYRSYWIQNMLRVTVDASLLQEISYQPGIKYIEFYHEPYPDVMGHDLGKQYGSEYGPFPPTDMKTNTLKELAGWTEFGPGSIEAVEWNISRVNADDVWGLGITGSGAVIGDLDTGVQWDHPALINQYRGWDGSTADHNYNWYDGGVTTVPLDYATHGTHTMGTIVGYDGANNQIGMAPGADWIACPGIGSPNVGPFECFEFFMAPTDLQGNNPNPALAPHVISNSWSSAGTDFHGAIQALYAAGIFFSKSAGNTGSACSTITNPGQWPEVTAAAAFANGDTIASFSSRGPVTINYDKYVKPDIAAPGVTIRSSLPGSTYGSMSGTSMACPHITGAVALLISANPELAGKIDILQMLLKTTAEPKVSAQCAPFVDHPNDVWGWGILNIYDAVLDAQVVTLGEIQGTVYDSSTNQAIPNAILTYTLLDKDWPFGDMADIAGEFDASLVAGSYDITAELYGYQPDTVEDVLIEKGSTTTQDIYLDPAPFWTVAGVVTEQQTGDPLSATLEFVDTGVIVNTDSDTGVYSADLAEGTYWLKVSSPGHSAQVVQVVVDQELTRDFELTAIYNYYMRQQECQPSFNWIDATGGTQVTFNDNDDGYASYSFPAGKTIEFYGNTYASMYIGTNGIITFGAYNDKWSGPIPDPATPNNGIYAFSTDLFVGVGGTGRVYRTIVDDRYLVVEWYQVQHYPSGDPETFEIVLDFDTSAIKFQYLDVSDPSDAVSGVENSAGTEATQYAYADPVLIADDIAVGFYPWFDTPPPSGGFADLSGTITDAQSGDKLEGAWAFATAFTTGETFSFQTDVAGGYAGQLCADNYSIWAEKEGYYPSSEVQLSIFEGTLNVQNFSLGIAPVLIYTPTEVLATIDGAGTFDTILTFINDGGIELSYSVEITPAVSWLSIEPVSGTVAPTSTQELTATFDSTGLNAGVYQTLVQVATNDPESSLIDIPAVLTVTCNPVSGLSFGYLPEVPREDVKVTFEGAASGTLPILYSWDFGDDSTGLGEVVTHTYTETGEYMVVLTGTNCAGIPVVYTETVMVEAACIPVHDVEVTWTPETPLVAETVSFSATAQGDEPFTFEWSFSDGFTATGSIVEHAFDLAGIYTVTVTVNNCGYVPVTVEYTVTVLPMKVALPLVLKY